MSRILLFILALTSSLKAFAGDDPSVVPQVDLKRYSGFWFEIAHSPNFFQGSCERSTAEYGLNQDGSISVLNSCFRNNEP